MAPLYVRVLVGQHAQYQGPETDSPEWNTTLIKVINYTCAFPAMACQYMCFQKGLFMCVTFEKSSDQHCTVNNDGFVCRLDHLRETKYNRL